MGGCDALLIRKATSSLNKGTIAFLLPTYEVRGVHASANILTQYFSHNASFFFYFFQKYR